MYKQYACVTDFLTNTSFELQEHFKSLVNKVYDRDVALSELISSNYSIATLSDNDELHALCIFKPDYRSHIGNIIHIDTISVDQPGKGNGAKMINALKLFYNRPIQLECKVCNKLAQEFYLAKGFEQRGYSFILT